MPILPENWRRDSNYETLKKSWLRQLIQGAVLFLAGGVFALASLFNTDVHILYAIGFSLLPLGGLMLLFLGIQECVAAWLAKTLHEFYQNLQVGLLDTVVGLLILLNLSQEPQRLGLMIASFLIVRGAVRVILVNTLNLPQRTVTTIAGTVSVALGMMILSGWFNDLPLFLSLCINLEIAFRGWAMMMFAWWLKARPAGA